MKGQDRHLRGQIRCMPTGSLICRKARRIAKHREIKRLRRTGKDLTQA